MSSSSSSSSALDYYAPAGKTLLDSLRHLKHDKWGWVIYRCTYGDDEAWARFQQIIDERSRERLAEPDVPPEVANNVEWTFVSDPTTLDGASRDELRRRFRAWAAVAQKTEQPRAEKPCPHFRSQRYDYFIQVDEEGLRTVVDGDPSDPLDVGWVNIVRADEYLESLRDLKEGEFVEEEGDESWMMIASHMVGLDFYSDLENHEYWYVCYTTPSGLVAVF